MIFSRCAFHLSAVPSVLIPPVVFVGLVLSLWFYKCCMMIIFQNKIIYMPGIPLFARRERLADYARECLPVTWAEERIIASDGTEIALCIGTIPDVSTQEVDQDLTGNDVVILYFQGWG